MKEQRWDKTYAQKSDAFSGSAQWATEAHGLLTQAEVHQAGTVLDFACNTGRLVEMGQKRLPNTRFIGVDINEEAIKIAGKRMPDAVWATSLSDIKDESVDLVTCMHALPQLQFPREEFTEVWRVLKRGGRFVLITNNKFNDWQYVLKNLFTGYRHDSTRFANYSLNDTKRLFKDTGFQVEKAVRFGIDGPFPGIDLLKPRILVVGRKAGAA